MAEYDNTYSRVVAWLKVLLPLIALVILSTLFLLSNRIEPDSTLPYSQGRVAEIVRDQRIVGPDFAGVTGDGAAIKLSAESARPLPDAPKQAEAERIEGRIETPDGGRLDLTAGSGTLDNESRLADLASGVLVETSTGYTARTEEMRAMLDRAELVAPRTVEAEGPPGTLTAGAMELRRSAEGRYLLVFKNGVKLVYTPPEH